MARLVFVFLLQAVFVLAEIQASSSPDEWAAVIAMQQLGEGFSGAAVNAVVSKDGSGDFTTITSAIDAAPRNRTSRYLIRVAKGVYDETVRVPWDLWNLELFGDGIDVTVVTGSRAVDDGYAMPETATVGT